MSTHFPTPTPATVPGVAATTVASLRGKVDRIETIFKEATAKIAKLTNDPSISVRMTTDEVNRAQQQTNDAISTVKAVAVQELAKLKLETERQRDEVLRGVARALGRPEPANATEALLREQREGRAWARLKPLLDGQPADYTAITNTVKQAATEAMAAGDEDTLAALRVELVAYMRGRSAPAPEEAAKRLDELIGGERPAVAAALALQREVEGGVYSVTLAVNYTTGAIERGTPFIAIPNWDGKTTRNLAMPGVDVKTGRALKDSDEQLVI